jgi:PPM family protein phosphatase
MIVETDGAVIAAGRSHRGLQLADNGDAMAGSATAERTIVVLADGLSPGRRADPTARIAVETGHAELAREVPGRSPGGATAAAFAAADAGVSVRAQPGHPHPPATTYLSAVLTHGVQPEIVIVSVGDTRAYWISAPGNLEESRLLTVDDAVNGAGLTRWLGAGAPPTAASAQTLYPRGPGVLVLVTDGLWRNLPDVEALRRAAGPHLFDDPVAAADAIVAAALAAGATDNVSSVVVMVAPAVM